MTAPRVYQWLTYNGNDDKKASRSHNDFFELSEDRWTENDPRFVVQSMIDFKYHVWDDVASFLAWYEGIIEPTHRHYCEWIRGDQHQKLRFDFNLGARRGKDPPEAPNLLSWPTTSFDCVAQGRGQSRLT